MASTATRLTLKFNFNQLLRACGWSESYDLGFSSLLAAINSLGTINKFLLDRCNCLGIGPVLVEAVLGAYVQPLLPGAAPVRRNTQSIAVPNPPAPGTAYNKSFVGLLDPLAYVADYGPTVLYVDLETSLADTPVYRRSLWVAGIPDTADQTNAPQPTDGRVLQALNIFLTDLTNGGGNAGQRNNVSIRSIDRSGANPVKPASAWNIGVPTTYTVTAHGFVANQPIIAEGMITVKGGFAPRGRYLVDKVIDANTITLQGAGTPTAPVKYGGFRAAIFTFNSIDTAVSQGFTKRNKGRPSLLSVGRRRKPATGRA